VGVGVIPDPRAWVCEFSLFVSVMRSVLCTSLRASGPSSLHFPHSPNFNNNNQSVQCRGTSWDLSCQYTCHSSGEDIRLVNAGIETDFVTSLTQTDWPWHLCRALSTMWVKRSQRIPCSIKTPSSTCSLYCMGQNQVLLLTKYVYQLVYIFFCFTVKNTGRKVKFHQYHPIWYNPEAPHEIFLVNLLTILRVKIKGG
jgi:hypothetical protein